MIVRSQLIRTPSRSASCGFLVVGGHLLAGAAVDDDRVLGAEPAGHAGGVHRGVAAAVDGDVTPDHRLVAGGDAAQERHRVHHRAGVAGRDVDTFGQVRADRDEHRVEAALVPLGGEVVDPMVTGHPHAHRHDPVQLGIQHVAGQPVARNAVPHHPAGHGARVADLDLVAEPRQVVGGGQSARPRADDQDSLAGPGGRWFEHPAALPGQVAEEPLHRMDRHCAVEMGSVADGFTRVIAHPAVDCGEWVVRDELTPRGFVPTGGGVRQPGLDVLSGGTTGIARRQQVDVDGSAFTHRAGREDARGCRSASGVRSSESAISRGIGRWFRASAERHDRGIPPRSRRRIAWIHTDDHTLPADPQVQVQTAVVDRDRQHAK